MNTETKKNKFKKNIKNNKLLMKMNKNLLDMLIG